MSGSEELLRGLARHANLSPRFLPIPWQSVYAAMRAAERAKVRLPIRSDSLLGLVHPAPSVPRVGEWNSYGVVLRPLVSDLS